MKKPTLQRQQKEFYKAAEQVLAFWSETGAVSDGARSECRRCRDGENAEKPDWREAVHRELLGGDRLSEPIEHFEQVPHCRVFYPSKVTG
jgi:hypothetical protein